jgi:glycosyltransferase involved in cell wall biosynthesis
LKIVLDTIPILYSDGADYRTTLNLYKELMRNDKKNEYSLLCIDKNNRKARCRNLVDERSIEVHAIKMPVRVLSWAWTVLNYPNLETITGNADLYHVAGIYAPPTKRAKILVTIRGIVAEVVPEYLESKKVKILKNVLRKAMKRADFYLAVSESTKKEMIEYLGIDQDKIFVLPHGVDLGGRRIIKKTRVKKFLEKKYHIRKPFILYVGAIGHHKNIKKILEAYSILSPHVNKSHDMLLVGPPDSAWDYAKQFIDKRNMRNNIRLMGPIAPESQDLVYLYNGADCFIFPSFYEGWCSPPMEAMACGTAVIASNRSSIPETVSNAACLINPEDVDEIASKIELILNDNIIRETYVKKGLQRVKKLTWHESSKRLMKIYGKIEEKI